MCLKQRLRLNFAIFEFIFNTLIYQYQTKNHKQETNKINRNIQGYKAIKKLASKHVPIVTRNDSVAVVALPR
jgi:hypothetical protein